MRDLRGECVDARDGVYRPVPVLTLRLFRNASHQFDSIGPSLDLMSLSERTVKRSGMFSIEREGSDPRLKDLTNAFGKPRRAGCVARWKRYVRPDLFRIYFFDDLEKNPAELRRSILLFLGADPNKPSGRLKANVNQDARKYKLRFTDKVRSRVAQFFEQELKACAAELGGPAKQWPARYGFSLLVIVAQLLDDLDVFFWVDWVT